MNFPRRDGHRNKEHRGGYHRRNDGNNRGYKRKWSEPQSKELTPADRLRSLLVRIGEKSKLSLTKNLDGLSKAVQIDLANREDLILDTIFDCVLHLGVKVPIHATLVGLITIWEPEFGEKIIKRLKDGISECVTKGDIYKLRLFLRFLACLMNANVIISADFTRVLKQLLDMLKNDSIPQRDRDHFAHITMSSVLFCGKALQNSPDDIQLIMDELRAYMSSRDTSVHSQLQPLSTQSIQFLEDYWEAFEEVSEKRFLVESILKPHEDFERLSKCTEQSFILDLPEWRSPSTMHGVNSFGVLKLVESEEEVSKMEQLVVSEYLHDIIKVFHGSPSHAAEHIINLQLQFDHKFLSMEAIFSRMLQIPQPSQIYVYYGRIIIELFDKQPKVWPKAVGRCLLHLFEKMEHMDVEVRDRLAHWFALHLNNFGNNWPWHKWNFVVNLDENNPKRQFCTQVLRLQMHLGEWERVMNSITEPFNTLMPSPPNSAMKYNTKSFESQDTGNKSPDQLAGELVRMLNRKLSVEDVSKHIETWFDPNVHGPHGVVEIFMTCLLQVGNQSYSHFLSYFKTYQEVLRDSLRSSGAKVVLLQALYEFWQKSEDRVIALVEKMHQYKLCNSQAVAEFVFDEKNRGKHCNPFWIQMLCQSLDRVFLTHDGLMSRRELGEEKLKTLSNAEAISDLEGKLAQIERALQNITPMLYNILEAVFSGFRDQLSEFLSDDSDTDFRYKTAVGNFIWISRRFQKNIRPHTLTLRDKLFSDASRCPAEVTEVWDNFWSIPEW